MLPGATRRAHSRIVLSGSLCGGQGEYGRWAMLVGTLYGPTGICLGLYAFKGTWPVSRVAQLGVGTVILARCLARPDPAAVGAARGGGGDGGGGVGEDGARRGGGALPVLFVEEAHLRALRADEPSGGKGVAPPTGRHASPLRYVPPPPPPPPLPLTADARVEVAREAHRAAWLRLWAEEDAALVAPLPMHLTGVAPPTAGARAEALRAARARLASADDAHATARAERAASVERERCARVAGARARQVRALEGREGGGLHAAKRRGSLVAMWTRAADSGGGAVSGGQGSGGAVGQGGGG